MGWISARHMKQGGSIGGRRKGRTYAKDGAPLRKIVATIVHNGNLFQPDRVELECGHEADAWGSVRARCPACKVVPCCRCVGNTTAEKKNEVWRSEDGKDADFACASCRDEDPDVDPE